MIAAVLAALAGIAVLIVRYRRREPLIVFMPLVPLGLGLVVIAVLLAVDVGVIAA